MNRRLLPPQSCCKYNPNNEMRWLGRRVETYDLRLSWTTRSRNSTSTEIAFFVQMDYSALISIWVPNRFFRGSVSKARPLMSTFGRCGTPALEMERAIDTPIPQLFADHIAPPASCAYRPYEGQGSRGGVDAVHRDVVRAGIRHIGELPGRINANRARRHSRRYCSYGR